jgi:hypothetical protein
MADTGGGSDDFVDSITLFKVKDLDDLTIQVYKEMEDYHDWVVNGIVTFVEIDTLAQAKRHMDFFHKELNDNLDTDCWRLSVDLPMIESKKKDVLSRDNFTMTLTDIK